MACIVEGAERMRWSVPEWIARNAFFFLIPELARIDEAKPLAKRLAQAMQERASFVNIGDFFTSPDRTAIWQTAIDRADEHIASENPSDWNNPNAYEPFRTAFKRLRLIAPKPAESRA